MRVALYGGSFDPIHIAHVEVAKTILKEKLADEVWFVPTYHNPWKETSGASFAMRVKMLKAVTRPYRKMKVCTIEEMWDDASYTIRTVEALQKCYPMHMFSYLIGSDQARALPKWKDIDKLVKLIPFYVLTRDEKQIISPYPLHFVQMNVIEASSTDVRNNVMSLVPKAARIIIGKYGLYLDSCVKAILSEKRYAHSVSVAKLAVDIAKSNHLDERKAWIAGILHDVCKELPKPLAKKQMELYYPNLLEEAPAIWHGYLGAHYAKEHFRIMDQDVLSAIYHHVKGNGTGVYDKLIYVCDKLDPLRPYDSSKTIALCKKDLSKGYIEVKKQQLLYLKKEKVIE